MNKINEPETSVYWVYPKHLQIHERNICTNKKLIMKAETKMSILYNVKVIVSLLGFALKWKGRKALFPWPGDICTDSLFLTIVKSRINVSFLSLRSKWSVVDNTTIRNTSYSPSFNLRGSTFTYPFYCCTSKWYFSLQKEENCLCLSW